MSPSGCSTRPSAPRPRPNGRSCRRSARCCSGAPGGSTWRSPSSTGRWHGSTSVRSRSIWSRRSTTAASCMSKQVACARRTPICCAAGTSRTGTGSRSSARPSGSTWAVSTSSPATCLRRCARSPLPVPTTRPWLRGGSAVSRSNEPGRCSPPACSARPTASWPTRLRRQPGKVRATCSPRRWRPAPRRPCWRTAPTRRPTSHARRSRRSRAAATPAAPRWPSCWPCAPSGPPHPPRQST